ncbi:hypothetical protein [Nocardioides sp.]
MTAVRRRSVIDKRTSATSEVATNLAPWGCTRAADQVASSSYETAP